jgi:two-component system cell cycle sensor histidine kinase/response regulator CckA
MATNEELKREIDGRNRAEDSLRSSELRNRALIEDSKDAIYVCSTDGVVLQVNRATEILESRPRQEIIGRPVLESAPPAQRERFRRALAATVSEGTLGGFKTLISKADGVSVPVEISASVVELETERVIQAIVRDVSPRVHAEEALLESEGRYREIFDASPLPMWAYDEADLNILAVNEAAILHYGYSRAEFLAMTILDLCSADEKQRLVDAREADPSPTDREHEGIWKHRRKDGELIDVDVFTHLVLRQGRRTRLGVILDVTAQRAMEEHLRQIQKLEAVGRLAGGVAHDFNNLITVISGYASIARSRIAEGDPLRMVLDEVMKASRRAGELTRQLLAFSRMQVLQPRIVELGVVVAETEDMLRRLIGEDIELVVTVPRTGCCVEVDPGQVEQILMNLAANARDAMPKGGRLTVQIEIIEIEPDGGPLGSGVEAGQYVVLTVSDTGLGMSEEVLSRSFDPFFTTKEVGQGTGLGLATVHGIVKQMGGQIVATRQLQRGTTLTIYFPRVSDATPSTDTTPDEAQIGRGDESILLVEDEESLRHLVTEFLRACGYSVIEATNGPEALALINRPETTFQLLMTDVVMPGLTGRELAERAQRLRPEMKVVFMSGYTDDAVIRSGLRYEQVAFLQKPFTREVLCRLVRRVLDSPMVGSSVPVIHVEPAIEPTHGGKSAGR